MSDNRDMEATITNHGTRRKVMSESAKLTALTGLIQAKQHKHYGIKPTNNRGTRDQPVPIPPHVDGRGAIRKGMERAADMWPDTNSWDMLGCDDISNGWGDAQCYATWPTFDSWTGPEPDGFSSAGGDE